MSNDKEEFLRQKKGIRNEADMTAQQLVNIYRQLAVLGEGATKRYNEQLVRQVNPDVLASFKTIPGGDEVRDYYNFLTHKDNDAEEQYSPSDNDLNDLLPQPEEISPLWESYQMPHVVSVPTDQTMPSTMSENNAVSVAGPKEVSVITKTVEVKVGLDEQKVKQSLSDLLEKQKQMFEKAFNGIIIDSNIEVMNANLKQAFKQIMDGFQNMESQIDSILSESKVDGTPVVVSQTEETKRKPISVASIKNVRKKLEHKFSVDMSDEEE